MKRGGNRGAQVARARARTMLLVTRSRNLEAKRDFLDGQERRPPNQPQKSKLWAVHEIDTDPARYRHRYATRGETGEWGGLFLRMREWAPGSFKRGKGLRRGKGRFALYVQSVEVGRTDDAQYALAYWRASAECFTGCSMADTGR